MKRFILFVSLTLSSFWLFAQKDRKPADPTDSVVEGPGMKMIKEGNKVRLSSKSPVFKNLAEMRNVPDNLLDTGTIYFRNTRGLLLPYKWNLNSQQPDDSVTIIQRSAKDRGRFELYFEDRVMAEWFGAIANDGADDSYAFQKAINFCVRTSKKPRLVVGSGNFIVNNVNIFRDQNLDGQYEFNTMTIEGAFPAFNANQINTGAQTVFECTDGSGFSLAIQFGRNIIIRNISFVGKSPSPGTPKNTFEWSNSEWTKGVRNNQFSPHAGIVIDPYHVNVKKENRYPANNSYYTSIGGSGTSLVLIDGCAFRNFVVGIMVSPNSYSQNGDNIRVTNFATENCRSFWASGQTQSRVNSMENGYVLGGTQYLVNCVEYGESRGSAPSVTNVNIAGGVKYLYHITGGFNGITFTNCRAESLYALGKSSTMPVDFVACEIAMAIPNENNTFSSPVLAEGDVVNFFGGTLEYFDAIYAAALPFNVASLNFNSTYIRGFPLNSEYLMQHTFLNARVEDPVFGPREMWESKTIHRIDVTQINNMILPGSGSYVNTVGQTYRATDPKFDWIFIENAPIVINRKSYTAWFRASDAGAYRERDMLSTQMRIDDPSDIFSPTNTTLGWVSRVSGDTVFLKYPPHGLKESTPYSIYLTRMPKLIARTTGNLTNGGNVVSNVRKYQSTFLVGSMIKGTGIPPGTRVIAIGNGTLTLSRKATLTATDVELYDAKYQLTAHAASPDDINYQNPGWFRGDIIYNTRFTGNNESVFAWICVEPGFTGTSRPPKFKKISFMPSGPSN